MYTIQGKLLMKWLWYLLFPSPPPQTNSPPPVLPLFCPCSLFTPTNSICSKLKSSAVIELMMKQRVDSDKDDNKDPNGKDNDDLIFDTTTNLWLDAFLAERGGYFDNDDDPQRQRQRQQCTNEDNNEATNGKDNDDLTTITIDKRGARIVVMIGSTGGVEGALTQQSTICRGATMTVRRQRSGQNVSAFEPGERRETDMGYQGSAPPLSVSRVCWRRPAD